MSEAEDRRPEIGVEHRYERFFSGPIPPASEFEYYENVLPGSANRILGMAEREHDHSILYRKLMLFFAFVAVLSMLGLAGYVIAAGLPLVSTLLGVSPAAVTAVGGGVVYVRRNNNKLQMEQDEHKLSLEFQRDQHKVALEYNRERQQLALKSGGNLERDDHKEDKEDG